ncbi:MAG: hypothetical protein KGK02_04465 [Rhodospirillales bacterium]|nr:hypothetical protein [Rhodospirillales bacterium]
MKIPFAVILAGLAAFPALARQDPTPPPSGVVIHMFGPNSVTSQIMSGTTSNPTGNTTPSGTTTSGQAAPEPTFGDIFHQMFVTGDPAKNTPAFPKGRSSNF